MLRFLSFVFGVLFVSAFASAVPASSYFIIPDVGSIGVYTNPDVNPDRSLVFFETNIVSTKEIISLAVLYNGDPDNNPDTTQTTLQVSVNGTMEPARDLDDQTHNFHLDWFGNKVTTLIMHRSYVQEGLQREQASTNVFMEPFTFVSSSGDFGNSFDNTNNVWLWSSNVTWVLESEVSVSLGSSSFGSVSFVPEPSSIAMLSSVLAIVKRRR